ncbi:MAG: bifunctional UDP-N-acetylmuramoyl-tripeptide:D-alanyl-D-alanine ligase/alanine racemase [Reichenbachiella sp.]
MKFKDLESLCEGKIIQVVQNAEVSELITDTRNLSVRVGSVFFAIAGKNHDGHKYVGDAYKSGVRSFVVERSVKLPDDAAIIQVSNCIDALQAIARNHRSSFNYPVIGVTGSNGKTIIKEWLTQMLDYKYSVVKSPKSFNSQLGVPLSVWQMSDHHNVGIFEAGISRMQEMEKLEPIIRPSVGIFTNIGEAHNAGFSSKQQKADEKALLFKDSKKIVFCGAHLEVVKALEKNVKNKEAFYAWNIIKQEDRKIDIEVKEEVISLRVKFNDSASIENAIHCAVTLHILGFGTDTIQSRIDTLTSVKMRLEMKQAINRSYVIDDTYNNDLYGLEIALSFLNSHKQKSKKTIILSDLYQTGLESKDLYARVSEMVKTNKINRLIGIGNEIASSKEIFQMESEFFLNTKDFLASEFKIQDEIVLVKGSRNFAFEQIVSRLEYKAHGTILEINLENVIHNLNHFRSLIKPETKMMVMVKAFAYGGGNYEIANLLQYHKVDYLGVAYTDEAVDLRKNGIHLPIMIMNPSPDSFRLLKEFNLEPEIYSLDQFYDFIEYFEGQDSFPSIHIKLETGMNRLGFKKNEIQRLIELLKIHKGISVKSIFSHLAGSDDPRHKDFTLSQAKTFEELSEQIMNGLWYKPMRHLINTGGIVSYPEMQFDMVRLGIGLYGFDPAASESKVQVVGNLKSTISQVKTIKSGESIGYGRAGFAPKDMKIAVVPIGYADGYLRAFSNGIGKMLVKDKLVPTIGNVCMDMTMLDITGLNVHSGDEVVIFGENPGIQELANWINTIPYEILTNVSQRVKRTYVSG